MRLKIANLYILSMCLNTMLAVSIQGIYKEESNEEESKDSKQGYIFKEDIYKNNNPIFTNVFKKASLYYANMLSLSDTQTLIYNGLAMQYRHPFVFNKMQLDTFANISFGNALFTTQTTQSNAGFFGTNLGVNASIPLPIKDVISHGVFGIDIGFGMLGWQKNNMLFKGFFAIDFLYDNYVFRPFIALSFITPFKRTEDISIALLADIGLKTFYRDDYMLASISATLSNLFSKNNANVFTLLPQSTPLFLGTNTLRLNVNASIDYFATKHLGFNAMGFFTYTLSYYALNVGAQVGATYRF